MSESLESRIEKLEQAVGELRSVRPSIPHDVLRAALKDALDDNDWSFDDEGLDELVRALERNLR